MFPRSGIDQNQQARSPMKREVGPNKLFLCFFWSQVKTWRRGLGYFQGRRWIWGEAGMGPLAEMQREEGIWQQSDGFPVKAGPEGKKEPSGPPMASEMPQQEAGRSGQRRPA
ncbi:hypothetical protein GOODEAATRI_008621 [Goodea atripinnis]|uniref:Uncharacterized protein n=1 Tax=Goodea atripinnis TaxID=208336 RepID=A0ABV0NSU5_9TELE